ncbi:hypothetical protein Lepto7376_2901 [[Leptolyngbya] sp. PCC 7376]|uniref:hypothetical protein n=1 Tax=[Leptolyngbya] sp. PCC 7376 TaxID=111781 RepID=UPI00029F225A|nr:hypothetical protein [[Leptolyngbya] sp. PCC 7376]AFY39153.1 hypothetical protein Lepto7376_2901 [[Leptolyngbya] sp. PCC 7376]
MTKFSSLFTLAAVASGAFFLATAPAIAQPSTFTIASSGSGLDILANGKPFSGQISGTAGGTQDSTGCGWMSNRPNHTFSVSADNIVSMKIRVTNPTGATTVPYTLMIKNASDPSASPFCAIAAAGIPAEIGGVWSQEGNYEIFVGNFESSTARDSYILEISK